jgi:O-antigen/teichoic acid export membrane protein
LVVLPFVTRENWELTAALPFVVWSLVMSASGWWRTGVSPIEVLKVINMQSMSHLRHSVGFLASNGLSTLFQQVPVLALSLVYEPAQLAGFAFAHRLCMSTVSLFGSLGAALYPRLVRGAEESVPRATRMAMRAMFAIGFFALLLASIAVGLYAVPQIRNLFFIGLTWGGYLPMVLYLVLRSMRVAPMRLLMASGRENWAAYVTCLVLILYSTLLATLSVMSSLSIVNGAVLFVLCEAGVLISLCVIAARFSRLT